MPDGKQIIEEAVLNGGLLIRSCQGWGSLIKTFFTNHFNHEGAPEDKALTKIMDIFTLELNS